MGRQHKYNLKQLSTVEPVIFFYAFAMFLHVPVSQQYIYYRIAKSKGFPYKPNQESSSCGNTTLNHTMLEMEKQVQALSSYVHLGVIMFSAVPSLFTSLLIGSWSDFRGRKPALFLPALGSTLEAGLVILVMYMEWPVYVLFIGGAINGICGFFTTIIMGVMAYIADTTDESERALRLAVLELITFIGGMISQLTSGIWIEKSGFIEPYWFILGCLAFSVIYTVLFVPESRDPSEMDPNFKLFSCKSLKRIYDVYAAPRENGRRNLILLTLSNGWVQVIAQGLTSVGTLFILHSPLCFSPEYVGYYSAVRSLSIGLGAILGIKLLGKCLSELTIVRIGITTRIGSLILFGFSKTKLQVFMVPLAGFFNGCSIPIFRAIMSRVVAKDEQGALFSAVASMETLANFIGAFMFSTIYPASLKIDFPPMAFLLGAGFMILPLLFLSCLKNPMSLLPKKDREQVVGNYERQVDVEDSLRTCSNIEGSVNQEVPVADDKSSVNSTVRQRENPAGCFTDI